MGVGRRQEEALQWGWQLSLREQQRHCPSRHLLLALVFVGASLPLSLSAVVWLFSLVIWLVMLLMIEAFAS